MGDIEGGLGEVGRGAVVLDRSITSIHPKQRIRKNASIITN